MCRFPKEVSAIFDQILAILLLSNLEEGSNSGVTSFFQIKRDSVSFTSFLQITFLENSQLKGSNSRTLYQFYLIRVDLLPFMQSFELVVSYIKEVNTS